MAKKKQPKSSMTDLQALVCGMVMGALWQTASSTTSQGETLLDIWVEPVMDEDGYLPEVRVTGKNSGEQLLIKVIAIAPQQELPVEEPQH